MTSDASLHWRDLPASVLSLLRRGSVITAHPLALVAEHVFLQRLDVVVEDADFAVAVGVQAGRRDAQQLDQWNAGDGRHLLLGLRLQGVQASERTFSKLNSSLVLVDGPRATVRPHAVEQVQAREDVIPVFATQDGGHIGLQHRDGEAGDQVRHALSRAQPVFDVGQRHLR